MAALLALALLAALPARAGPWPRGAGNHFVSLTARTAQSGDGSFATSYGYYHEFGLTDRLTAVADLYGTSESLDKAIASLTYPLPEVAGLLSGLGLGAGWVEGQAVLRPGLSLGRGLQDPSGWATTEAAVVVFASGQRLDWSWDSTLGRNFDSGRKAYLQLQTGQNNHALPFARLAASAVLPLPRVGGLDLDLGVSTALYNSDPLRLKLGIWHDF